MENTQDLAKLGYREIDQLADLLKAYAKNGADFLGDNVQWEYNPTSDSLFLIDEDYNVAVMNGDKLEQWHSCAYCGHEGFAEDFEHEPEDPDCTEEMERVKSV